MNPTKFAGHTPAPWLYRETYFGNRPTPAVSHGDTSNYMCWLNMSGAYGGNIGIERARADGRLIAAAPRLLAENQRLIEALRGMVSIHDSVTMGQEREYRELHLPIARALLAELETDK